MYAAADPLLSRFPRLLCESDSSIRFTSNDLKEEEFKKSLLMTLEEKQCIEGMDNKMKITQKTTGDLMKVLEGMDHEKLALDNEIEMKFNHMVDALMQRKQILLNEVSANIDHKKAILNGKIESLCAFQSTLGDYKTQCLSFLNADKNERKDKIFEIHEECSKKFVYTVEKTQIGVPQIALRMNTGDVMDAVGCYGKVKVVVADTMRMVPVLNMVTNNGRDNTVGVSWKLRTSFIGIDKDLVSNIKIEWLQIDAFKDDDEIKEVLS